MKVTSLDAFYQEIATMADTEPGRLLPDGIQKEVGHFNVFNLDELLRDASGQPPMPYDRRAYYKISLITGRNRAEYADKVIEIEQSALLFATPRVPYHWVPRDQKQSGQFCIFTDEFLVQTKSGVMLDDLPIFKAGGYPVFQVSEEESVDIRAIFDKMQREITSTYAYKYDLLRNYVLELIHFGQKLQPVTALSPAPSASNPGDLPVYRIAGTAVSHPDYPAKLHLRTAKDYADRLAVHVNHLNKALKENTGHTTTELIGGRVIQEAKVLLKQTSWTVSEISDSLGFAEVAHFSNFFKRQTTFSPVAFRA